MAAPIILAIDAASRFGWASGPAGGKPISGSANFARSKSPSHGAIFWGAMRWITAEIERSRPDSIVIEAPLPGSFNVGKTNAKTARILTGLPAAIEGMAFGLGIYDVSVANLSSIRKHFLGKSNLPGPEAKAAIHRKCVSLGWVAIDDEDQTFDRSDALAIWSYAEARIAPAVSQPVDDLFLKRRTA